MTSTVVHGYPPSQFQRGSWFLSSFAVDMRLSADDVRYDVIGTASQIGDQIFTGVSENFDHNLTVARVSSLQYASNWRSICSLRSTVVLESMASM